MDRLEAACRRNLTRAVLALATIYAVVFAALGVLQYRGYTPAFDLPIFAQAVDGLLRGKLFGSIRGMVWLGDHSSLILFLLAPLYAVFRHPLTLVIVQSVALALGAFPIAALARRRLGSAALALGFAALYLLYPALGYSNLFEFHPEVLCTATLLAAFNALDEGRFARAFGWSALSLLGKEDVAFVVLGLSIYALVTRGGRAAGRAAALAALAGVSLVISFVVLKPRFNTGEANYLQMYEAWGPTPGAIVAHLLHHPLEAARALFGTAGVAGDTVLKRAYFVEMLAPLVFLPLLSPVTLAIALPIVAEHFLSNREPQHTIVCQYTALVTPFVFAAAVLGLRNLLEAVHAPGAGPIARVTMAGALIATFAANLVYGPVTGLARERLMPGFEPVRPSTSDWALAPYRDELVRRAGHPRGVVAGFEFLTRFVSSPDVQSLHHVVLGRYTYSTRPYPAPHDVTVLIGDMSNPYLQDCVDPGSGARMRDLIARNRLVPVAAAGDNLLFLRDSPDSIELVSFPGRMPEAARRVVYDGSVAYRGWDPPAEVTPGGLLSIRTYWERLGPTRAVYNTEIVVSDSSDSARIDRSRMIGYLFAPVADWPMHTMLRETYRLPIPPDLAPGDYEFGLRVGQQSGDTEWAARPDDPDVIDNDSTLVLGRIRVRSPGARQTGRP